MLLTNSRISDRTLAIIDRLALTSTNRVSRLPTLARSRFGMFILAIFMSFFAPKKFHLKSSKLYDPGPMISASQWGSPLAPRRAFLIHGLAMCSNTWEGVARLLVAEGQIDTLAILIFSDKVDQGSLS